MSKTKDERIICLNRIEIGMRKLIKTHGVENLTLSFKSIYLSIQAILGVSKATAVNYADIILCKLHINKYDLVKIDDYKMRLEI